MTIQIGIIIILVTILALELIARYFYKKEIAARHDLVCRQSKEIKELKIVLDNTRKELRERTSRCDDLKKEFTDRVNEYNMTRQKEARIVASGINEIANLGIAGNFRGIEGEEIITKMFPRLVLEIRNRVEGNRANYDAFGNIVVPPPAPPSPPPAARRPPRR